MNDNMTLTLIVFLLFLLFTVLPMIPMLQSIYKKEDVEPLYMDLEYIVNPKFQAEHFDKISESEEKKFTKISIGSELNMAAVPSEISRQLLFSSMENVSLNAKLEKSAILHSKGDIVTQKHSRISALKSDGSINIGENSIVETWIDAAQNITIEKDANVNLVTAKSVRLHAGAKFKRIYADTIGIYPLNQGDENKKGIDINRDKTSQYIEDEVLYLEVDGIIKQGSNINNDIVCRGDLIIEENCKILGSIKTNGTLEVGNNTFVYGNIFSDKEIEIKDDCYVFGNIFSHTYLKIGHNGQMGRYDLPKSIIGIKGVQIAGGTFLHNYILTYGEGRIV